jgi:predicted nucleotidyltransferase
MNHDERIDAACMISAKLLERHPNDGVATAVTGSVARGDDHEFSDLDMQVIVREGADIASHTFVLKGCLVRIDVKTERAWKKELEDPSDKLPFVIGSLETIQPIYDPAGSFKKLREMARNVPDEAWKMAVCRGLEEIVEDQGRVRNFYVRDEAENLRVMAPAVAAELALVYASIRKMVLHSEKDLSAVFERALGADSRAARDYRIAARIEDSSDEDVVRMLERLHDFVFREAADRSCGFKDHESAEEYEPP